MRRQFEAMLAEHRPAMYATALRLCRSHFEAEDIVQDAALRAMRTTAPLQDPAKARAWLLRIVTRTFLDELRRKLRLPVHVEIEDDLIAQDPAPVSPWGHITADDVNAAIGSLPDDVRDTYRMFAIEGRDYAAVAAALEIKKTTTVGTRVFRARKLLRAILLGEPAPSRGKGSR